MGEPTTPSPIDRVARRRFARDIIESVRNDEEMPLPLQVVPVHGAGEHFRRTDVEQVAFDLAQELDMLRDEIATVDSALGDWDWEGLLHEATHGSIESTVLRSALRTIARVAAARKEARRG